MPTITDWLMVIITLVYVVATVFICIANIKSAKAAREQTEEMKKQFSLINRPSVSAEIVYLKRTFWMLRFNNNGNQVSYNTKIIIEDHWMSLKIKYVLLELINIMIFSLEQMNIEICQIKRILKVLLFPMILVEKSFLIILRLK